jgi:hypothetical protein
MSPSPRTAVPSETIATVLPLMVSVNAASGSSWIAPQIRATPGRVGHGEVVAGLDRDLRADLDLAALVEQERPVGDVVHRDVPERRHGGHHALAVGGVHARPP